MVNTEGLREILNYYNVVWGEMCCESIFQDENVIIVQVIFWNDTKRSLNLFPEILSRDFAFGKVYPAGIDFIGFTAVEASDLLDYLVKNKNKWWED